MATIERRYFELRAEAGGRTLSGVAVRYGDVATVLPWGRERIEAGAFGDVAGADVVLNVQHDRGRPIARTGGGGLTLADGPDALAVRAELPPTREADDALANVRGLIVRGLSAEFVAIAERMESGVRVIERAELVGLGLVDTPAYPQSEIEARRAALPSPVAAPAVPLWALS